MRFHFFAICALAVFSAIGMTTSNPFAAGLKEIPSSIADELVGGACGNAYASGDCIASPADGSCPINNGYRKLTTGSGFKPTGTPIFCGVNTDCTGLKMYDAIYPDPCGG